MALDKLSLFTQKAGMQAITPTKSVGAEQARGVTESSKSNNNPFAGGTVGVNSNIGVGDSMNIPAQVGKKAGMGRTLAFA